ncbi:hypothetical protein HR17_05480 [Porphyromonas gulae]|uniref:glycosyltransferase family 4 protein n=1 Tax=Porphyromonas gulae TaxID=111105 RepID=UPI00052D3309|nr:glycosyltransferase family 4 protein [Porphyromonas gulae]KGN74583.1 hypothetical protein HR17_05480 [Porphyromonas gulae]KGO04751.1 hypothetical protein HR16_03640 [Porphyromonas gulae]
MKVIFCDNNLGGLLSFRRPVISHFLFKGWEVVLLYPKTTKKETLISQIPLGCKVIETKMRPSGTSISQDLHFFKELYGIYRRERPDLVLHFTIKPNIFGTLAAKLSGIKYKVLMVAGLGYVFQGNSLAKRLGRILYKIAFKLTDRIITLNEANRDKLLTEGWVAPEKMILFSGGEGVDLTTYPFRSNHFHQVRFLMVARLFYDKGYREFVGAARLVKAVYPEVQFDLLGALDNTSPMSVPEEELNHDIAEGAINYLGESTDVPSIVGKDGVVVVVVSSYHEGMNRVLMEACAMGRPVIASNAPGCRELVDDSVNGYCIPPKNVKVLADAMLRFIALSEEDKQAMGIAGYEKAKKQFDVNLVIKQYDDLLQNLNIT